MRHQALEAVQIELYGPPADVKWPAEVCPVVPARATCSGILGHGWIAAARLRPCLGRLYELNGHTPVHLEHELARSVAVPEGN